MSLDAVLLLRMKQLLVLGAALCTLVITPNRNFDGVLLGKQLVLSVTASALMAMLLWPQQNLWKNIPKILKLLSLAFAVWILITVLFSGAPIDQQLWGVFGRNSGAITYLSLLVFFLAALLMKSKSDYRYILIGFLVTSLIVTFYALLQIAGKDPVPWSELRTFSTLGNVNFLSAFLGMVSAGLFALVLSNQKGIGLRFAQVLLIALNVWIISTTGSIQGLMVFSAGSLVAVFLRLREHVKVFRKLAIPYLAVSFGFLFLVLMALTNNGPLAKYIFQTSIILRGDYMHAGFEMMMKKPIFGVGMDSYGDWYREMRGEITTLRGSPDRVSNSAHNIMLDLGASGGIILFLTYIVLIFVVGYYALRYLSQTKKYDPVFTALLIAWIGYIIQATVSINQVGVSVWGWLLQGCVLGYSLSEISKGQTEDLQEKVFAKNNLTLKNSKAKRDIPLLPAPLSLVIIAASILGFCLYWPPFSADASYKQSTRTGDLIMIEAASERLGGTLFHRELVLETALNQGLQSEAQRIAYEIVQKNPRDFFAWKIIALTSPTASPQRNEAIRNLRILDPFNLEIPIE